MKARRLHFASVAAVLTFLLRSAVSVHAATSINPTNKFAYGANIGWMDWRGNTNSGAVIGEYVCSGYLYAANVGWINLGSNAPANGIQYQNNSATDYGVNHDGLGNLRGFAWGANIGWLNFESNGAPRVNLATGKLSGSIYSANCGWLSLSNAFAVVQTDHIPAGADSNANGLPDAWERTFFGALGVNPNADADGDGASNQQEYLAGTNPTNSADKLVITTYGTTPGGTQATVQWRSTTTRLYSIQKTLDLATPVWLDSGLGVFVPTGATTARTFTDSNAPRRFYRVQALRPLQ
ncbi:MAG TPA: thrombospondin type 3 repeat-containing protein [Candidatus Dormibacteraeota bacterium]|nr:thrombospondin type 3 repeat-containing protein [Candidatus Dormibacteraeota bacterium]